MTSGGNLVRAVIGVLALCATACGHCGERASQTNAPAPKATTRARGTEPGAQLASATPAVEPSSALLRAFELRPARGPWDEATARHLPVPAGLSEGRLLLALHPVASQAVQRRAPRAPGAPLGGALLAGFWADDGSMVAPPIFPAALPYSEGLAAARHPCTGRWGYLDTSGHVALSFEFDAAGYFSEGLAAVQRVGRAGFDYIDRGGKLAIEGEFWAAGAFLAGRAAVAHRDPESGEVGWFTIDVRGHRVWGAQVAVAPQRFLPRALQGLGPEPDNRALSVARLVNHPLLDVPRPEGTPSIPARSGLPPPPAYGLLVREAAPGDGTTAYLDADGAAVFNIPSEVACRVRGGFVPVLIDRRWWVYGADGRVVASGEL